MPFWNVYRQGGSLGISKMGGYIGALGIPEGSNIMRLTATLGILSRISCVGIHRALANSLLESQMTRLLKACMSQPHLSCRTTCFFLPKFGPFTFPEFWRCTPLQRQKLAAFVGIPGNPLSIPGWNPRAQVSLSISRNFRGPPSRKGLEA